MLRYKIYKEVELERGQHKECDSCLNAFVLMSAGFCKVQSTCKQFTTNSYHSRALQCKLILYSAASLVRNEKPIKVFNECSFQVFLYCKVEY